MPRLTVSFDPEDDRHGELLVNVESGGFAGKSAAWFTKEKLKAFGTMLGAFPIGPGEEPTLCGGFWDSDDQLDQAHVSIRIGPAGLHGELLVKVLLATPFQGSAQSDQHSVHVHFPVNYSDLAVFQREFSALLSGERLKACLEATPT